MAWKNSIDPFIKLQSATPEGPTGVRALVCLQMGAGSLGALL